MAKIGSHIFNSNERARQSQLRIQDFPGGAPTPQVGTQTYYLGHFPPKLIKLKKKKLDQDGVRVPRSPLDALEEIH